MADHAAIVENFELELQTAGRFLEAIWAVAAHTAPVPTAAEAAEALSAFEVVTGDLLPQLRCSIEDVAFRPEVA